MTILLGMLLSAAALVIYVLGVMLMETRRRNEALLSAPTPVTDPGVNRLKAHLLTKTNLPIDDMYRIKGHWYIQVSGALVKVEDVLRKQTPYNANAEAQEAMRNFNQIHAA